MGIRKELEIMNVTNFYNHMKKLQQVFEETSEHKLQWCYCMDNVLMDFLCEEIFPDIVKSDKFFEYVERKGLIYKGGEND